MRDYRKKRPPVATEDSYIELTNHKTRYAAERPSLTEERDDGSVVVLFPGLKIVGDWDMISNFMVDLDQHISILSQKHGVTVTRRTKKKV